MLPLSPALLIGAANAFIGLGENEGSSHGSWRGGLIDCFLREVRAQSERESPAPWDAAFAHHVGYWSHFDGDIGQSSWPLPATASSAELGRFAFERGVLRDEPERGDLFLLRSGTHSGFTRTGIIVHINDRGYSRTRDPWYECLTVEGNTDRTMAASGPLVLRHYRRLDPERGDRFVRWSRIAVSLAAVADERGVPVLKRVA